ncbi:universal stress protein [Sphingomonas qilianensis]|uniref:Universal stress protein n=1 Tax=Sphingomonas qilianensis TaxID=1736690 RepID=A0ABU9XM69_9SPHN
MKNILLLVHDDTGQEARFQAALDLGRAVGGHLSCLDVSIMPAYLGGDGFGGFPATALLAEEREREDENRTRLESRLGHEDVPWDWTAITGALAPCLMDASALADVIVVNRQLDDYPVPDMRAAVSELVVKSGKPVLAVPPDLKRLDLSRAMIAWDGSPCSAAALRAAVPLLRLADQVTILEVEDGSVHPPVEEAATYLSREGIHATIRRAARTGERTAAIIVKQASLISAGYIVMGGFGHRRFVEALFGGTTRSLLSNSPLPLFLAH